MFDFSKSDMASLLFGNFIGGISSLSFNMFFVLRQREPLVD